MKTNVAIPLLRYDDPYFSFTTLHWAGPDAGKACPPEACLLDDEDVDGIGGDLLAAWRRGITRAEGYVEDGPFIGVKCCRTWHYFELLDDPTEDPSCWMRWEALKVKKTEASNGG